MGGGISCLQTPGRLQTGKGWGGRSKMSRLRQVGVKSGMYNAGRKCSCKLGSAKDKKFICMRQRVEEDLPCGPSTPPGTQGHSSCAPWGWAEPGCTGSSS